MTTKLPSIPEFDGTNAAEVIGAIKEALEVRVGRRGDTLDAGVTFRDLEALGYIDQAGAGSGQSGLSAGVRVTSTLNPGGIPELYDPSADLTPPPAPSDLKATAVFETVLLSWSQASFPNQSFWEVWRSFTNDLSSAVLIGTSSSQFFTDVAQSNQTYYYWVRTVSAAGIKSAWNSSFGTEVTTGVDPAKLIAILEGQILESALSQDLASKISVSFDQARATVQRLTAEVNNRIQAISNEATTRAQAIQAEADARAEALLAEAAARGAAITAEQLIRQEEDESLAASIETVTAAVEDAAAAIETESVARAAADQSEASSRQTLATQLRGGYSGNDLNQVTTGLIFQEKTARSLADQGLAQQITLLSAGSGDQFDWKAVWYFDEGIEGWEGNGTPTVSAGYLRPANQSSGAFVYSPTGIDANANTYGQSRLRIRKVGSPTFAGYLWWRSPSDSTWDSSRRVALTEPTYDTNNIGLITVYPNWTGTIDRIRIDLSSAQTASNYFEIDWVAVGRPAPGASSAQLVEEQLARAAADAAEASARETLSTVLVGQEDPTGLTLPTLTSGLLYSERVARSDADGALAEDITLLEATVNDNYSELSADILSESSARASAVSAEAASRNALAVQLRGSYSGTDVAQLTQGLIYNEVTARTSADETITESVSSLSAVVNTKNKTFYQATAPTSGLVEGDLWFDTANDNQAKRWNGGSWVPTDDLRIAQNAADILSEASARASADSAEAQARNTLSAQIRGGYTGNDINQLTAGLLYSEKVARATEDEALAESIDTLSSTLGGQTSTIQTIQSTVNGNQAKYTVKIDNNGHVSGFGLLSESNNGTPTSAFIIRADKFAIVDPASTSNSLTNFPSTDTVPFAYVSGVSGVPNGVYIKDAFIQNASITDAKIGSVAAKKILAGNIDATIGIRSANIHGASLYAGGTTSVNGDGSFSTSNPTFKVEGGNVEIVSSNFRIKSLATATSYITPFKVENGVVYIDTAYIKSGDITTAMIQNATITSAQITSLTAEKIVPSPNGLTIDANLITLDGNVTLDTYYDSSIGRSRLRIKDLGVTTAKINDLAVTTGKIANLAVDTLKIAGNAVTQPQVYTATDLYVSQAINNTSSGVNYTPQYVGANQGDYAYVLVYYNPYEPDYVLQYVGPNQGDHIMVVSYSTPTFTGATTAIETPTITVGVDATAAVQIVYYATLDAGTQNDAGQHLFMLLDTGSGYRLVAQTTVGTRTSSGNTYAAIPIAMTYTARNITTAKVQIVTGTRRVDLAPGTGSNASWLRNSTISFMGAKR